MSSTWPASVSLAWPGQPAPAPALPRVVPGLGVPPPRSPRLAPWASATPPLWQDSSGSWLQSMEASPSKVLPFGVSSPTRLLPGGAGRAPLEATAGLARSSSSPTLVLATTAPPSSPPPVQALAQPFQPVVQPPPTLVLAEEQANRISSVLHECKSRMARTRREMNEVMSQRDALYHSLQQAENDFQRSARDWNQVQEDLFSVRRALSALAADRGGDSAELQPGSSQPASPRSWEGAVGVPPSRARGLSELQAGVNGGAFREVAKPASWGQAFLADNSRLQARTRGLGFRRQPLLADLDEELSPLPWGSVVYGVPISEEWVQVAEPAPSSSWLEATAAMTARATSSEGLATPRFLPACLQGELVLLPVPEKALEEALAPVPRRGSSSSTFTLEAAAPQRTEEELLAEAATFGLNGQVVGSRQQPTDQQDFAPRSTLQLAEAEAVVTEIVRDTLERAEELQESGADQALAFSAESGNQLATIAQAIVTEVLEPLDSRRFDARLSLDAYPRRKSVAAAGQYIAALTQSVVPRFGPSATFPLPGSPQSSAAAAAASAVVARARSSGGAVAAAEALASLTNAVFTDPSLCNGLAVASGGSQEAEVLLEEERRRTLLHIDQVLREESAPSFSLSRAEAAALEETAEAVEQLSRVELVNMERAESHGAVERLLAESTATRLRSQQLLKGATPAVVPEPPSAEARLVPMPTMEAVVAAAAAAPPVVQRVRIEEREVEVEI